MYAKFLTACVLILSGMAFSKKNSALAYTSKWVVEKNSSLSIQGETNINSFECDVTEYLRPDTLICLKNDASSELRFMPNCLSVDIRSFDCHNTFITDNFRKTLKANENPTLKILLLSVDKFPTGCDNKIVKGMVDVELAQAIKRAIINYSVRTLPGNRICMNGSYIFSFSDFNLKAPNKFAGLIRTKDRIKVNFHLYLKALG
jgi:hypothetical protein